MNLLNRISFGGAVMALAAGTAGARADVVSDWNGALTQLSAHASTTLMPHVEARVYAMTHLAMHEAVAAAARERRPVGASEVVARVAAGAAAHDVLVQLLPRRAQQFDGLLATELALIREPAEKARGLQLGGEAATAVLLKRDSDGWMPISELNPAVDLAPLRGVAGFRAAFADGPPKTPWETATPFMLKKVAQIEVEPLVTLSFDGAVVEHHWLRRAKAFDAVDRSALEQLPQFWSERPIAVWNRVAQRIADAAGLDLASRTRVLAALNVALADATLGALHWRYVLGSWRSVYFDHTNTFAAAEDPADVNASAEAFAASGGHPKQVMLAPVANYPSIAAALAGAAEGVLTKLGPAGQVAFSLPPPDGAGEAPRARAFRDVKAAARECAFTSSLDGHHSREACVTGYEFGVTVGNYVAKRLPR
jgi:hypothetical protein